MANVRFRMTIQITHIDDAEMNLLLKNVDKFIEICHLP